MRGWVARNDYINRHGELILFFEKPYRDGNFGWKSNGVHIHIKDNEFDVQWHEEPLEVEIKIELI